jgi:serine/threonine-protein phosphatase 2A regulatory subunit B''
MSIKFDSLEKYDSGAMTFAIIDRAINGYGKKSTLDKSTCSMSYEDFVWFILSVEDKSNPQAIEYWFRCLDLDG